MVLPPLTQRLAGAQAHPVTIAWLAVSPEYGFHRGIVDENGCAAGIQQWDFQSALSIPDLQAALGAGLTFRTGGSTSQREPDFGPRGAGEYE
jgi:hypothetical protein